MNTIQPQKTIELSNTRSRTTSRRQFLSSLCPMTTSRNVLDTTLPYSPARAGTDGGGCTFSSPRQIRDSNFDSNLDFCIKILEEAELLVNATAKELDDILAIDKHETAGRGRNESNLPPPPQQQ